jgi:hypothetical protein
MGSEKFKDEKEGKVTEKSRRENEQTGGQTHAKIR